MKIVLENGVEISVVLDGEGYPLINISTGGGLYSDNLRPTVEVTLNDVTIHEMFDADDMRWSLEAEKDPSGEFEFEDIDVVSANGLAMVTLSYDGEGMEGDYDPENPEDYPHLRYTIYRKRTPDADPNFADYGDLEDGEWAAVHNGSYCTRLNARTSRNVLEQKAQEILFKVSYNVFLQKRDKKYWEELSWID